jgi:hypothetical protein
LKASSHSIEAEVTDSAQNSHSQTFAIALTMLMRPHRTSTAMALDNRAIDENAAADNVVAMGTTDADAGDYLRAN